MDRHVTSVFSEYETMDNNSANSKQLQFWLKQISNPVSGPNAFEWTFMSNQSSNTEYFRSLSNNHVDHIQDQMSFGKTVHSSIERDKENNSLVSNGNNRVAGQSKNKSYVNAMVALQKKVKSLEDENAFLRMNITKINQQRSQSMSESSATEQGLKSRLKVIEPKLAKIDDLIEENKILRETKEEKNRKAKLLQKSNQQLKVQNQQLTHNFNLLKQQNGHIKQELQIYRRKVSQLESQLKKLYEKNKMLEEMKEKSTVSLLEKYNKSIELVESLQKQNGKLKNQVHHLKTKHVQDLKNIQESHRNQIKKCQIEFEKLKQSVNMKESLIEEKKREAQYFRDAYSKKDEEFMELIRSQHKFVQNQVKLSNESKISKVEKEPPTEKITQVVPPKQEKAQVYEVSKQSSAVRMPQTLIPGRSPQDQKSFDVFDSEQQDQFDESAIPVPIQTKSVGKPVKKRKSERKAVLSSESRKAESRSKENAKKKDNDNVSSPKQVRKVIKKKKNNEIQEASFTMKSCEPPKTQPMHKITFEGDHLNSSQNQKQNRIANSYYYTSSHPPLPHPYYRGYNVAQEEIQDFQCRNNASHQSIDEAMVVELQKELLQLYEEQQNLLLASKDEYATHAERSEFVGRLKQINELLNIKNQKICDLKSKI